MLSGRNFLTLILPLLITFGVGCKAPSKRDVFSAYSLSSIEKSLLQEGDIVLRHGYGFVSNTIVKTLAEEYAISHAGIIVKDKSGRLKVVHAVSQSISDFDGVQDVDLDTFVRDSQPGSIVVVRYKGDSDRADQLISERALHYLDRKIPFDYSFSFEDSTRFFCSEFIGRVLADVYGQNVLLQLYPAGISSLEKLSFGVFLEPETFDFVIDHQKMF